MEPGAAGVPIWVAVTRHFHPQSLQQVSSLVFSKSHSQAEMFPPAHLCYFAGITVTFSDDYISTRSQPHPPAANPLQPQTAGRPGLSAPAPVPGPPLPNRARTPSSPPHLPPYPDRIDLDVGLSAHSGGPYLAKDCSGLVLVVFGSVNRKCQ